MAKRLSFNKILKEAELRKRLEEDLSDYVIQNIPFEKGFQVRKSKFTTQSIPIKIKEKSNIIHVGSPTDYALLYLLICFPLGLYILFKRKKYSAFQQEVIDKIKSYHRSTVTNN